MKPGDYFHSKSELQEYRIDRIDGSTIHGTIFFYALDGQIQMMGPNTSSEFMLSLYFYSKSFVPGPLPMGMQVDAAGNLVCTPITG